MYLEFRLIRFRDNKAKFKNELVIKDGRWGDFIWIRCIRNIKWGLIEIKGKDFRLKRQLKRKKVKV